MIEHVHFFELSAEDALQSCKILHLLLKKLMKDEGQSLRTEMLWLKNV